MLRQFHVFSEYGRLKETILGLPESFAEGERINEAMRTFYGTKQAPQKSGLVSEYCRLQEVLESNGVRVLSPTPSEESPQQLAPRDIGFVVGNTFVVSNMKWQSRGEEIKSIGHILRELEGPVLKVPADVLLEGGNIVIDKNKIFVGIGLRTGPEAVGFLENNFGNRFTIYPIFLSKKEEIVHLDAVFSLIKEDHAIVYPDGLEGVPSVLKDYRILEVSKKEKDGGACNVLSVNSEVLVLRNGLGRIESLLTKEGFKCHAVVWDEIRKTGTVGPRCATLPLIRED